MEGFREFLASAAAEGARDKGAPGEGAEASGQAHLWRDFGGLKTKQRIALLTEMQQVRAVRRRQRSSMRGGAARVHTCTTRARCRELHEPLERQRRSSGRSTVRHSTRLCTSPSHGPCTRCCCAAAAAAQVLEWCGQDRAFRQLAKHHGTPWAQLPHAAKKALLAAADQLDWSFLGGIAQVRVWSAAAAAGCLPGCPAAWILPLVLQSCCCCACCKHTKRRCSSAASAGVADSSAPRRGADGRAPPAPHLTAAAPAPAPLTHRRRAPRSPRAPACGR